ncbi:MAG: hypothetical protein HRT38_17355 [Alteromonadaceae bacterium]|nr:hypothetical protein [Alteromonadaceae bacterium]
MWLEGKDTWNKWVKEHPVANVDFSEVDFSKERNKKFPIAFVGFNFPSGKVYFFNATFGDGEVSFSRATFSNGNYIFRKITCKGHADFSCITEINRVKALDFKGSVFEKTLDLSYNSLSCIIDLTNTKMNNHVSLVLPPHFYALQSSVAVMKKIQR